LGHKERLPPSRLSGCCRFGQETFAGTHGNGRDTPKAADCGSRDGTDGVADQRSFADAALIVLAENNVLARAIHGIIALEDGPKRFASEPNA
jgi:hypothetical protein